MTPGRRNLIMLGGIIGIGYGLRVAPWESLPEFRQDYVAVDGLSTLRALANDAQRSISCVALVGVDPPSAGAGARQARAQAIRTDLRAAVLGAYALPGVISIAYFAEIRCPYYWTNEGDLNDPLAKTPDTLRLVQHELPIFGPSSELAVRASIAAERQGKRQILDQRSLRTPLMIDQRSVLAFAPAIDVDTEKFARYMGAPNVQAELDQSRTLAYVPGSSRHWDW